jgi:histidinol dehydrogenase
MNKIYNPNPNLVCYFERPTKTVDDIETVKEIFKEVQKGWSCSQIYFDFDRFLKIWRFRNKKLKSSAAVPTELKEAIQLAKSNIEKIPHGQKKHEWS